MTTNIKLKTYHCLAIGGEQPWGDADIVATSPAKAAKEYAEGGLEDYRDCTRRLTVDVTDPDGDETSHRVELAPIEPPCEDSDGRRHKKHDWEQMLHDQCGTCGHLGWSYECRRCRTGKHEGCAANECDVIRYWAAVEEEAS